jgi:two-component system NtrC family sensor kinase
MLRTKLHFKLIVATVSSLVLVVGIFFYFLHTYHKSQLTEGFITSTTNLSMLIEQSLEYAMFSRREDLLQTMVHRLAEDPEVEHIYILDRTGTIRISSDASRIGYTINRASPTCKLCHSEGANQHSTTAVFKAAGGREVLRNVTPLFNKTECHTCHSPTQSINGVLIMDFSMERINAQLSQDVWAMLAMSGVLVLVLAGAVGVYTNRLVLSKLKAVVRTTQRVRAGDLSARAAIAGSDEFAQLGESLNQMTSQLLDSLGELRATKEYLNHLINSVDDGIVVVDNSLRVVMVNDVYLEIIGRSKEELIGSHCSATCHQAIHPPDETATNCPARKAFETGRLHKTLISVPGEGGGERALEIFSSPIRGPGGTVDQVVEVVRDITERQRLEATLLHSEHLASMGMLAAGVSHEINNPLASIATAIEGVRRRMAEKPDGWEEPAEVAEYLELVQKEVSRCKRITDKLLILARQGPSEAQWVDLRTSVEETVSLVSLEADRRGVVLSCEWENDSLFVKADDGQLRQVLLNILLNAIQATEEDGSVVVKGTKADNDVTVSVADTGCGISPLEVKHIFEPFYTNKPLGQGTGLGLFISKNIIRDHGGDIVVESREGEGTTVTFSLLIEGPPRDDLVQMPEERGHFG